MNYLHWGESQTWYCVSGSYSDVFEEFRADRNGLINPKTLIANGMPVSCVVQEAGEFILTFCHSSVARVSHGFSFLEAVNFCPDSWIPFGYDFSVRQLSGRCGFSFEELVFRLLLHLDSLDVSLVEILFRILSNLLHVEVGAVEGITALGLVKRKQETFELVSADVRRCRVCQKILFLFAVTCRCHEATMVCLNHFGDLCACASADHCLHYRYTLTVLEEKLKLLKGRIGTYNQWVQKVEDVLSASDDDRLELAKMKQLKVELGRLFRGCQLVSRLERVISEAESYSSFARLHFLNASPGSLGNTPRAKRTVEELQKFYDTVRGLPVRLKITDEVEAVLTTAVSFRSKLQNVISGSISDFATLDELKTALLALPVAFEEIARLQQLLEQRKWLDRVDHFLATTDCVTIELIGRLIDEGVAIHPHPTCEKMLIHLQQLQSHCHRLEEKAESCLYDKPSCPLSVVESLLNDASKVPVHLPVVHDLRLSAERASAWLANVENLLNGQTSPYLTEVEGCLEIGRSIPIQLEKVSELESLIAKAEEWIDKTSKAFLKKNSVYSLYEVLCPRADIGTPQSYRIRRKRAVDRRPGATDQPVHWLLPDINLSFPDPAAVANAFKVAESKEVDDIKSLRNDNLRKLSCELSPLARHCICRQGRTPNMMQCELCKEIFHSPCVSLPKSFQYKSGKSSVLSSSSDLKFFCPMCMRTRRPHLDSVVGLLLELGKFPVRLPEGEALQSLAEHAFSWQDRARRLLSTDELTRALTRLTVLNQQMAEHAAKVKTEKIIHSELLKAARHGLTGQGIDHMIHRHSAFPQMTSLGQRMSHALPFAYSDFSEVPLGPLPHEEVEVETGSTPFEHAYSSAAVSLPRRFDSSSSSDPVVELSEAMLEEVKLLIIEGDLLEVSVEETHHLWKIMKACRLDQIRPFELMDDAGEDCVQEDDGKTEKAAKRKRKSSHNMKIDEGFEVESVAKHIKQKSKKTKGFVMQDKKSEKSAAVNRLKSRMKQRRERNRPIKSLDLERCSVKTAEDCDVEKCLRPLGNAVQWVQCDGCEKWFHYFCLGLTKRDISEHEDFLCQRCQTTASHEVSLGAVASSAQQMSLPGILPLSSFVGL